MESDGDGVNEFLQRIRELGDKRDREDEERAKKLEEEIIAGREARRARRDGPCFLFKCFFFLVEFVADSSDRACEVFIASEGLTSLKFRVAHAGHIATGDRR